MLYVRLCSKIKNYAPIMRKHNPGHPNEDAYSVKNSLCNCIIAHIFNFITQRFNF
jgi:hypothetical protein